MSVPAGAIDTHVHVFDPAQYPYDPQSKYLPVPAETATAAALATLLDAHGMHGVVIVDPTSGYDGDSRCLVGALDVLGPRARGVLRWSPRHAPPSRDTLRRPGIAGVRVDCVADGLDRLASADFHQLARHLADLDLVLDVQCERDQLQHVVPILRGLPTRNVVDHLGRPDPARGARHPAFIELVALAAQGRTCVKLSAPMRMSNQPGFADVDPFVELLLERAGPAALVWGSDWPFLRADARYDYAPMLALLERWIPNARDRARVLVDTPRDLFFRQ